MVACSEHVLGMCLEYDISYGLLIGKNGLSQARFGCVVEIFVRPILCASLWHEFNIKLGRGSCMCLCVFYFVCLCELSVDGKRKGLSHCTYGCRSRFDKKS